LTIVVDTSMALAWFMPEEQGPIAVEVLSEVTQRGAVIPSFFRVEFGNALIMAVRRKRIDMDYRRRAFERIAELELAIDHAGANEGLPVAIALADVHLTSLYDSLYLELALRVGLPLATLDKQLAGAALDRGIMRT
jgi:predicted nucleic acid-binding protein